MLSKLLIVILVINLIAKTMGCTRYICSGKTERDGVCANWSNRGVELKTCKEKDQICRMPDGMNNEIHCSDKYVIKILYPGEYCEKDTQCIGNAKCINNVCRGKAVNEKCNSDKDCDVEMYCKDNKCTEVATSCANGEKCASNRICYNKTCNIIGQLPIGAYTEIPELCTSYYTKGNRCAPGPTLVGSIDCPGSGICTYKDGDEEVKKDCECGKSESDKKYCPPGRGDIDMLPVYLRYDNSMQLILLHLTDVNVILREVLYARGKRV